MKVVYIVICYMVESGDGTYHIDSAWTSEKKAGRRVKELNSEEKKRMERRILLWILSSRENNN